MDGQHDISPLLVFNHKSRCCRSCLSYIAKRKSLNLKYYFPVGWGHTKGNSIYVFSLHVTATWVFTTKKTKLKFQQNKKVKFETLIQEVCQLKLKRLKGWSISNNMWKLCDKIWNESLGLRLNHTFLLPYRLDFTLCRLWVAYTYQSVCSFSIATGIQMQTSV